MQIKAIAQFAHGDWHAAIGDQRDLPDAAAAGLIRAGLCEPVEAEAGDSEAGKAAAAPKNKAAPVASNKGA